MVEIEGNIGNDESLAIWVKENWLIGRLDVCLVKSDHPILRWIKLGKVCCCETELYTKILVK